MNVLVTGGAGYIGSHACKALASAGYIPITYDNLSRGNRWAVKWGPLIEGDIADGARIQEAINTFKPVALMHFAALAYVGESVQHPLQYYQNNVSGTACLLKAILDTKKIPVVFSSTCATYGVPDQVPISEDHPQRPINPYGSSKLFVEKILRDLNSSDGVPWIALRYFNAAGADPDGDIGEGHDPETHLIPLAIAAVRGQSPLQVFGDDYETPDGTCIRDYVHVSDIAAAHVLAVKHLLKGERSCALNLANARGYSVKEVIATVERVTGRAVQYRTVPRRSGDPAVLVGDARQALAVLGWKPTQSDLETQVKHAWEWFKKRD